MKKHTSSHAPGPWNVNQDYICDVQSINGKIATAWSTDEVGLSLIVSGAVPSPEEQEANARLIAAAPDMLEALQVWQAANALGDAELLAEARVKRDVAIWAAIGSTFKPSAKEGQTA